MFLAGALPKTQPLAALRYVRDESATYAQTRTQRRRNGASLDRAEREVAHAGIARIAGITGIVASSRHLGASRAVARIGDEPRRASRHGACTRGRLFDG